MHVCYLLRVLISREISQSCNKLLLFLRLTHVLSQRVHIMVCRAHLQFSCSFKHKRHSCFDFPLFLPLNMCRHVQAGQEGNPPQKKSTSWT